MRRNSSRGSEPERRVGRYRATAGNGRLIELVNKIATRDSERDVEGRNVWSAAGDPKVWLGRDTETGDVTLACYRGGNSRRSS